MIKSKKKIGIICVREERGYTGYDIGCDHWTSASRLGLACGEDKIGDNGGKKEIFEGLLQPDKESGFLVPKRTAQKYLGQGQGTTEMESSNRFEHSPV